ncbi:flagellar hook-basal body complex protein FliE [Candidatus Fukatsuia symbiotica]|nr:flagellar hook-basal body complex protein FliE [Candidatus Fukatsuia symbiotica]MEA9444916.1 flagellar hook-basal body complex protein FliE [Candidatus Fukatsuia symbiotica]
MTDEYKVNLMGIASLQAPILQKMQQVIVIAANGAFANTVLTLDKESTPFSFARIFDHAIDSVDQLQHVASDKQEAIDMGISDDLTGTMLESQKASVAFSALQKVNDKLLTAMNEIINTPL